MTTKNEAECGPVNDNRKTLALLEILFTILLDIRDIHAVNVSELAAKFVQLVFKFIFSSTGKDFLLHVVLNELAALADFDSCFLFVSREDPHLNICLNKHVNCLGNAKLKLIFNSRRAAIG